MIARVLLSKLCKLQFDEVKLVESHEAGTWRRRVKSRVWHWPLTAAQGTKKTHFVGRRQLSQLWLCISVRPLKDPAMCVCVLEPDRSACVEKTILITIIKHEFSRLENAFCVWTNRAEWEVNTEVQLQTTKAKGRNVCQKREWMGEVVGKVRQLLEVLWKEVWKPTSEKIKVIAVQSGLGKVFQMLGPDKLRSIETQFNPALTFKFCWVFLGGVGWRGSGLGFFVGWWCFFIYFIFFCFYENLASSCILMAVASRIVSTRTYDSK